MSTGTVEPGLHRTYLYVPAHKPELFAKALAGPADAIVLDLEDGVPPSEKERARENVAALLAEPPAKPTWVRLNAATSPSFAADVVAAASPHLAGARLPKATQASDVARTVESFRSAGAAATPLAPLIESARGLHALAAIATASESVKVVALGEADLAADLGVEGEEGLGHARSLCVLASRVAGLMPPIQSVYTDLADSEGLRRSTELGRRLGFFGRSVIHPSQIDVVNRVFTPDSREVDWATAALAEARDGGHAVVEGSYVDAPVARRARRTLTLAERFGSTA